MARFKGDIAGSRGDASRLGDASSGISAHVRGWNEGIRIRGYAVGDSDHFEVYATGGSNGYTSDKLLGVLKAGEFEPAN
jgi:hypothetical protein